MTKGSRSFRAFTPHRENHRRDRRCASPGGGRLRRACFLSRLWGQGGAGIGILGVAIALLFLAGATLSDCQPTPEDFSIVLLPDTQYYSANGDSSGNPYYHQTAWIVENREAEKIRFVLHLGDMTDGNTEPEWVVADKAHDTLDAAGIPYTVIPGNHDYTRGGGGIIRDTARYNAWFGPERFAGKPWYGGSLGTTNDNNYAFFTVGNLKFLVVNLEYAPTRDAICWANDLIRRHPTHRVIVVTHCYLSHGGQGADNCADVYDMAGGGADTLWEELIQRHSNVFLVLSGHINDSEHVERRGVFGNVVHEVLTDYQFEAARACGRFGNGWLRLLRFRPAENRVDVVTKSVEAGNTTLFVDGVPWFFCNDYLPNPEGKDHQFSFTYDMTTPVVYRFSEEGSTTFHDRTVNATLTGTHLTPDIDRSVTGESVVVWEDDSNGNGLFEIYGRGLSAGGCETFPARGLNAVSDGQQRNPAVAIDDAGNFVVVWEDDADGNGLYQIMGRGFDAAGNERIPQFTVNTVAGGQQRNPAIDMDAEGNFVVVWEDDTDGNGLYQIMGRGFDAAGNERIPDFTVNTVASGQQRNPDIAMTPSGSFVVVWEDDQNANDIYNIFGRGFDAAGNERIPDFIVNREGNGEQRRPDIATDAEGNFVVVWEDDTDGNGLYQIMGRGFDAAGNERIPDFTVNTVADGQQRNPDVGADRAGNFVVVWEDDADGNGVRQILARGFDAGGNERLAEMTVNTNASGEQLAPAAVLGENVVVVWEDDMDRNGAFDILARGFEAVTTGPLAGRVVTTGETLVKEGFPERHGRAFPLPIGGQNR